MKRKIKCKILVFLCAYLRQVDLSLDRSRWTSWAELREYYKKEIEPSKVVQFLMDYSAMNSNKESAVYIAEETSRLKRIKYFLSCPVFKRYYLTSGEILYCCNLLIVFEGLLHADFSEYNSEIENLRVKVSKFNLGVLMCKLGRKDSDLAMGVEHYLQSEHLKVIKMEEFTKGIPI